MVFFLGTISPVMASWPAPKAFELHLEMVHHDPDRYIKPAGMVAFFSSIAVLFVDTNASTASLILDGLGVAGFVGVIVVSEGWNVPVNRQVARWPPGTSTAAYEPIRSRWLRAHLVRTVFGVVALVCLCISVVVR